MKNSANAIIEKRRTAKFDSSMFFYDGICRAFKGDVLQKLNDWPFWPFMLGHVGRINSSMGLSPASLPNLTVLCFSMMAFAKIFKEAFSETERQQFLEISAVCMDCMRCMTSIQTYLRIETTFSQGISHRIRTGIIAKFDIFMFFYDGIRRPYLGVLQN